MNVLPFEKACKKLGKNPAALPNTEGMTEIRAKRVVADHKLEIIYEAAIKGNEPDFSNRSQWKYTPWLRFDPSLGRFVDTGTDTRARTRASVLAFGSKTKTTLTSSINRMKN